MAKRRKRVRRIGILTGGGDCPGLNAVIRGVAKTAMLKHGVGVVGFCRLLREKLGNQRLILADGMSTRNQRAFGSARPSASQSAPRPRRCPTSWCSTSNSNPSKAASSPSF